MEEKEFTIKYGNLKKIDSADGPGVRVALYVSGCLFRCKGCHNQAALDYNYGEKFTNSTLEEIIEALKKEYITGFSILGGEPLDPKNREDVFKIIEEIHKAVPEKTIWLWSGYTYGEIMSFIPKNILECLEVIVDGPFVLHERDISLKFRGSRNQRVIDIKKTLKNETITYYCD